MKNRKIIFQITQIFGRVYSDDEKEYLFNAWSMYKKNYGSYLSKEKFLIQVVEFLYKNRVLEIFKYNCELVNDKLLYSLVNKIENKIKSKRKNVCFRNLEEIPKKLNNNDIIFIKGSALSRLYPCD